MLQKKRKKKKMKNKSVNLNFNIVVAKFDHMNDPRTSSALEGSDNSGDWGGEGGSSV